MISDMLLQQNTITNNTFAYIQKITTRLREIQAIHRVASRHMMQRIDRLEAIVVVGMSDEQQEVVQEFARGSHEPESAINEQVTHTPTPEYNGRNDPSVGSPRSKRPDELLMKVVSKSNQKGGRLPPIQGIEVDDRYMMSGALQDL